MADPSCLAMVLCDAVHQDRTTGKFTILGSFGAIRTLELPAQAIFQVYAEITDGLGLTEVQLKISESRAFIEESLSDGSYVWEHPAPLSINMTDPLGVYQVLFQVTQDLPRLGQYHCELLANGHEIMARRLLVIDARQLSNPGESHG